MVALRDVGQRHLLNVETEVGESLSGGCDHRRDVGVDRAERLGGPPDADKPAGRAGR